MPYQVPCETLTLGVRKGINGICVIRSSTRVLKYVIYDRTIKSLNLLKSIIFKMLKINSLYVSLSGEMKCL